MKHCKECNAILGYRQRKFCGTKCRNKNTNRRYSKYQLEYCRKRRDYFAAIPSDSKVQCLYCGKYYVQVGSHVVQSHGFKNAREYREYFDLEVRRGIIPEWYRQEKRNAALRNNSYRNLIQTGKKHRFKKGDKTLGVYKRSHITLQRLAMLRTIMKNAKKNSLIKKS